MIEPKEKNEKKEEKIQILLHQGNVIRDVTKTFTAYLTEYLHTEICGLFDPPDADDIKLWIEIAIEAFEGGDR